MPHFGQYEPVVEWALAQLGPAPWTVEDLVDCETWITNEPCRQIHPHCRPQDVIDWLHSLPARQREELVAHLNAERAKHPVTE